LLNIEELAGVLEIIFKKAVEEGEIPEEWREAYICPLLKNGRKMEAANCRPVTDFSMLQSDGRDNQGQHNSWQHGFVQHKACVTNLLVCLKD